MTTNFYTIQDFQGFMGTPLSSKYVLSQAILGAISTLEKNISAIARDIPDYSTRPRFSENGGYDNNASDYGNKNKYGNNSHSPQIFNGGKKAMQRINTNSNSSSGHRPPVSSDDWVTVRSFKTTKLDTKVGIDKDINDIRTFLNKISNKNYDKQKDAILNHISEFAENESDSSNEDTNKIAMFIFDIASTNKFFSEIYADLYSELITKFSVFSVILDKFIVSYKFMVDTIEYVDPSVDYDGFCLYTKQNDKRKAIASFIVMLMNRNVLSKECIVDIIQHFLNKFTECIEEPGRESDVEEFAEVLFVFITLGKTNLSSLECWNVVIVPSVKAISQMKFKSSPSITNRAIFKFMDIMDKVK
jgi:hypothetical protein